MAIAERLWTVLYALETSRDPQTGLLCCRCCQAPGVFFRPCILWTLCHIAPTGLVASRGVGTHPSPTTFYPCGLSRPSPEALYVFRRALEGLGEATPAIQRLFRKARTVSTGRLHQPQGRSLTEPYNTAYASCRTAPSGTPPRLRNRPSAMSNFRATATIPMRLRRLPPPPKRSRNQQLKALSGW